MPCSPSQAAPECDLNAQVCAQLEVVSPSGVCRGSTSGGQVKLSRKNDPGAEPARSHPDAVFIDLKLITVSFMKSNAHTHSP